MTPIVVLFALGLLMLSLEIFLPGGVLGVLGGLVMLGGSGLAFRDYGVAGGLLALLVALVLIALTFVIEFVILPRTRLGQRLILSSTITGVASVAAEPGLVGRPCEALTALAPTGVVLLDGRKLEAFCRDGFAERGERLVVRGTDNFRLIVSKS